MIYLFLIYLLFQAGYDHWAADTVAWKAIYYAFQYGWVGSIATVQATKGRYTEVYSIIALIMFIFSINFMTWTNINAAAFQMMTSGPPAYTLTILVVVLFFFIIILKKLQWAK